jgi:hypothetical protein
MLCLPYYAYVISLKKLVIRAEQYLPGTEVGRGDRWGEGTGWINDPMYANVNK